MYTAVSLLSTLLKQFSLPTQLVGLIARQFIASAQQDSNDFLLRLGDAHQFLYQLVTAVPTIGRCLIARLERAKLAEFGQQSLGVLLREVEWLRPLVSTMQVLGCQ